MKSLILIGAVALFPSFSLAAGTHDGGHDYAAGAPATEGEMKIVEVSMRETEDGAMVFEPKELSFAAGETVRLVITNKGEMKDVEGNKVKNNAGGSQGASRYML